MQITRTEDGTIIQNGGVTRVTHGHHEVPSGLQQDPSQATVKVGNSVTRWSASGGSAESSSSVVRYQAGSEAPVNASSIMATKRNDGRSITVELIPGNPVSRTNIRTAIRDGLVVEIAPGHYVDARTVETLAAAQRAGQLQGPNEVAPEADPEVPPEDQPWGAFDKKELDIWQQEVEPLTQSSYDAAIAGTIAQVVTGAGDLQSVAHKLAEANQMEPAQALEFVETGYEWHRNTLTKALGMTPEAAEGFYEWAARNPRLNEALQAFAVAGNPSVFKELARAYKVEKGNSFDASRLQDAGFDTMVDRVTGKVKVRRGNGPWMALDELAN